jgi:hypothetical protein
MVTGMKAFKSDFEARDSKWSNIVIPNIDFHFGSSKQFYPETIRRTVNGKPAERHSATQLLSSFERFDEIIFQRYPKKATPPKPSTTKTWHQKPQTLPNIKSPEVRSERSEPTRPIPNYQIPPMPMPTIPSSTVQMLTPQMPVMPMRFPSPIPWSSSASQKLQPLAAPSKLPSVPQMYPPPGNRH